MSTVIRCGGELESAMVHHRRHEQLEMAVVRGYLPARTPPPSYDAAMGTALRRGEESDGYSSTNSLNEDPHNEEKPMLEIVLTMCEYVFAFALILTVLLFQSNKYLQSRQSGQNDTVSDAGVLTNTGIPPTDYHYTQVMFAVTVLAVFLFELIKIGYYTSKNSTKEKCIQLGFNLWIFVSGLLITCLILDMTHGLIDTLGAPKEIVKNFLAQCSYLSMSSMNYTRSYHLKNLAYQQNFCNLIPSYTTTLNTYMAVFLTRYLNKYRRWSGMWFLQGSSYIFHMNFLIRTILYLPSHELEHPGRILMALMLGMSGALISASCIRPCPSFPLTIEEPAQRYREEEDERVYGEEPLNIYEVD